MCYMLWIIDTHSSNIYEIKNVHYIITVLELIVELRPSSIERDTVEMQVQLEKT